MVIGFLLQISVCAFAQFVAVIAILIGCGYIPELSHLLSLATSGQPWQAGELARLVACACGPILMGIYVSLGLIWYVRSSWVLRQRSAAFPGQPWLWRADWEAKRIRLSNAASIWFAVIAASSYLLIALPLGIYLASLKNAAMVYAFVGLVGIVLLFVLRMLWINRHRNRSTFQLETLPGLIGGRFSGIATIPLPLPTDASFHVTLRCEESVSVNGSSHSTDPVGLLVDTNRGHSPSRTQTSTVYEDTTCVGSDEGLRTPGSTSVRVAFEVPGKLPSTGTVTEVKVRSLQSNLRVTRFTTWSVRIRLATESVFREIVFEVPVFDISKSVTPTEAR